VTALPSMTVALGLITSTAKQETSQNWNEMPLHTCEDGYYQKDRN
jgi:hypothetical protein